MPKREKPPMPTEVRRTSPEDEFYAAQERPVERAPEPEPPAQQPARTSHTSHTSHTPEPPAPPEPEPAKPQPVERTNVTYRMDRSVQALIERLQLAIGLQQGGVPSKSDVVEMAIKRLADHHNIAAVDAAESRQA